MRYLRYTKIFNNFQIKYNCVTNRGAAKYMLHLKSQNTYTAKKINIEHCDIFSDIILISGAANSNEVPYYWRLNDKNEKPPLELAINPIDKMIYGFTIFCVKENYKPEADLDFSDINCFSTEGYEIDTKIFDNCQGILKFYDETGIYSITIRENKIICIFNNHIIHKCVQCINMELLLTKCNKLVGFIFLNVEDDILNTAKNFFEV